MNHRLALISLSFACALAAQAPRHELAFTLGQVRSQTRTPAAGAAIDLGSGTALQANYGLRVVGGGAVALYIGGHLLASPQRKVTSFNTLATRDFASLYLAPQVTLKLAPASRFSPWATFGGGYALYEQSTTRLDGAPNQAPRHIHKGTWLFGGGADIRLLRFLALRGEVRDFFTGSPALNVLLQKSGQHNIVVGGGFVLRF